MTTQICLLEAQVRGTADAGADNVKCAYATYNASGHALNSGSGSGSASDLDHAHDAVHGTSSDPARSRPAAADSTANNIAWDGSHRRQAGLDLHRFADLLIELGFVNAINLDGGASAAAVVNGSLVSSPTERCADTSIMTVQVSYGSFGAFKLMRAESLVLFVARSSADKDFSYRSHLLHILAHQFLSTNYTRARGRSYRSLACTIATTRPSFTRRQHSSPNAPRPARPPPCLSRCRFSSCCCSRPLCLCSSAAPYRSCRPASAANLTYCSRRRESGACCQ